VFPAHGAGSSCGKQLSTETSSTIGAQRRFNYALQPMTEDQFVATVTEGQPDRPQYFEFDAQRNRELRPLLDEGPPPPLSLGQVQARQRDGAVLLDTREPADFAAGHLRRAVNIGLQGRFAEWAGDVLPPHRDIVLVGDPATALEAKVRLARVGYDRVIGQLDAPAQALAGPADAAEASSRLTAAQLRALLEERSDVQLVDVRDRAETLGGSLPGARAIPLAALADALDGLSADAPTVVFCASGYRSSIAASVLVEAGFTDVSDLLGGYTAWDGGPR
jgi:rhodanese-related sulfurtransferase